MADNAKRTGAAIEAHYQFLAWLRQAVEKFPKNDKFTLGDRIVFTALDILDPLRPHRRFPGAARRGTARRIDADDSCGPGVAELRSGSAAENRLKISFKGAKFKPAKNESKCEHTHTCLAFAPA